MRLCLCLSVWPGITCPDLSITTVKESARGNYIITLRQSESWIVYWVNNKPATHWVMWCSARWKKCCYHCSVITHWKSCYLQTVLKVANSCCLCCSVWLSDSLAVFLHAPLGVFFFFCLQNIIIYCSLCATDKKMCFSPGKISLRMMAFDCRCTSGVGDTEAEYWQAKWYRYPSSSFSERIFDNFM